MVKELRDSLVKPADVSVTVTEAAESNVTEIVEPSEETAVSEIIETTQESEEDIDALSLWTSDAEAKKALVSYVENVTDENSPDYIPVVVRPILIISTTAF